MEITEEIIHKKILALKESKVFLDEMAERMLKADDKKMFWVDLLCIWIISRTHLLIAWFCDLIKNKNFLSASSLIRLHLDSLLQLYWVWLVDKPHDFANHKMNWNKTDKYSDKEWKIMKDWYLREKFFNDENNKDFYRLIDVYSETSWFIHFSDKHIFSSITSMKKWKFEMVLSDKMEYIPLEKEYEAIECMILITWWIVKYIHSWIITKENPKLCKK